MEHEKDDMAKVALLDCVCPYCDRINTELEPIGSGVCSNCDKMFRLPDYDTLTAKAKLFDEMVETLESVRDYLVSGPMDTEVYNVLAKAKDLK